MLIDELFLFKNGRNQVIYLHRRLECSQSNMNLEFVRLDMPLHIIDILLRQKEFLSVVLA